MISSHKVIAATVADRGCVLETLADAFVDDPLFKWFVRSDARADAGRMKLFDLMLPQSSNSQITIDMVEGGGGVAVWYAPGIAIGPQGLFPKLAWLPGIVTVSGIGRISRPLIVAQMLKRIHPIYSCAYLQFLGVRRGFQGRGLGGALLRHGLARVDAAQHPAFLETTNADNLPLYMRYGFDIAGEHLLAKNGPTFWAMPRAVRAGDEL